MQQVEMISLEDLVPKKHSYRDFFKITEELDCKFLKVRGHQVSNQKDDIDRLFTLVDRASRNALRDENR